MKETTKRKKVISVLIALMMAIAMMPGFAAQTYAEASNEGECGDSVTWRYDDTTKALTITGTGAMWDYGFQNNPDGSPVFDEHGFYVYRNTPWGNYNEKVEKIVVYEGVTSIGNAAFSSNHPISEGKSFANLKEVVLPSTLEKIGECAFEYAGYDSDKGSYTGNELKVNLPDNLKTMGECAFSNSAIKKIKIPDGVKKLDRTFDRSLIEQIDFGKVEEIGDFTFFQCENLKSVKLPDTLKVIGSCAFEGTTITEIVIPEGVTTLGTTYTDEQGTHTMPVFNNCENLKRVVLPSTLKFISELEFARCDKLEEIDYRGTEEQWKELTKGFPEDCELKQAVKKVKMNYNYDVKPQPVISISISNEKVALSADAFTYNGKVQKPRIVTIGGKTLQEGNDYTAAWSNASSKNAGSYDVTITGKGKYSGQTKAAYKINKAKNSLKVKAKTATVKYKKLKKKAQTLKVSKVIKFTKKGQGQLSYKKSTVTYTKAKSVKMSKKALKKYKKKVAKKITINKTTGKVTVKKGLKKGTYKVKVKVKAAGNVNYEASAWTTTAFKIKVR